MSTAPPRSRWAWPQVPAHVGPARTSTLILAVLFIGVFALYLVVRPESTTVTSTGSTGGVQPTQAQQTAPRTTPTPAPTTARSTTPSQSATTTSAASTSAGRTTSSSAGASSSTDSGTSQTPTQPSLLPTTAPAPSS